LVSILVPNVLVHKPTGSLTTQHGFSPCSNFESDCIASHNDFTIVSDFALVSNSSLLLPCI
jgi:hypothetical protein